MIASSGCHVAAVPALAVEYTHAPRGLPLATYAEGIYIGWIRSYIAALLPVH